MERDLRLAAAAWCAVLVAVGLVLTVVVQLRALVSNDHLLLLLAQAPRGQALDALMFGVSLLGSAEVSALLALGLAFLARRTPGFWIPLAVLVAINLVELVAKQVVAQPGVPRALNRGPHLGVFLGTPYSFPSGHATRATMLFGWGALALFGRARRWSILVACTLLVWLEAFSRVYLGDHWPTDVAGGILLGGAGLALALALAPRAILMLRER